MVIPDGLVYNVRFVTGDDDPHKRTILVRLFVVGVELNVQVLVSVTDITIKHFDLLWGN